jgi:hypothetical protein
MPNKSEVETLDINEPDFGDAGKALAELIKRRIVSAPGNRWNKTGRLLRSIAAVERHDGVSVVATSDRLQRDEVAQLFADEILPGDIDASTRTAIAEAVFDAFKVNK